MNIIAENISDNAKFRKYIRDNTYNYGTIKSKIKKNAQDENKTYDMYYDYEEKVKRKVCTAHKEGCSKCMTICPFYKQGYEKVKLRFDKKQKRLLNG